MISNIEIKINRDGLKTDYSLNKFIEVCNDNSEEAKIVKFYYLTQNIPFFG